MRLAFFVENGRIMSIKPLYGFLIAHSSERAYSLDGSGKEQRFGGANLLSSKPRTSLKEGSCLM
jgi:hypothetical protein